MIKNIIKFIEKKLDYIFAIEMAVISIILIILFLMRTVKMFDLFLRIGVSILFFISFFNDVFFCLYLQFKNSEELHYSISGGSRYGFVRYLFSPIPLIGNIIIYLIIRNHQVKK